MINPEDSSTHCLYMFPIFGARLKHINSSLAENYVHLDFFGIINIFSYL